MLGHKQEKILVRRQCLTRSGAYLMAERKQWQIQFDDFVISRRPKVEISDIISTRTTDSLLMAYAIPILQSKKLQSGQFRVKSYRQSREDCRNHLVRNFRSSSSKNEEKTQDFSTRNQATSKNSQNSKDYQLLILTNDKKNIIFPKGQCLRQVKRIERSTTDKDQILENQEANKETVREIKRLRPRRFSMCSVLKPKLAFMKKNSDKTNDTITPWELDKEEDSIF